MRRCCELFLLSVAVQLFGSFAYKIPDPKLELLRNGAGFRVSIPDEQGIKYVAFNINQNRPFKSFEPGEFSARISEPINNRWVFENRRQLEGNDIIYIWTNVQHNSLVYRSIAEPIEVSTITNNYQDKDATISDFTTRRAPVTTTQRHSVGVDNCRPSLTVVQKRNVCKDQLIFEENFDGALNTSRWRNEIRLPLDVGDAEFVLYEMNSQVSNGMLTILPVLWNENIPRTSIKQGRLDLGSRCTGTINRVQECIREPEGRVQNVMPPVITARVNTKNSFSFKYGRIEIRAKVPVGNWLTPLLLLEPLDNYYGQNAYESGQIRVAFVRGNKDLVTENGKQIDGRTLYGGAVLSTGAALRERSMVSTKQSVHFGEDFHVYSLEWNNRKLLLKVDGQEYGQVDGGYSNIYGDYSEASRVWIAGDYMAPLDQEFFITLGVSVGGHGDFPDGTLSLNQRKPWDNTSPKATLRFWKDRLNWKPTWTSPDLQVDYVRVYAI